MNLIRRFNTWYDNIKSPYRFLFFFFIIGAPFVLACSSAIPMPMLIRIPVIVIVVVLAIFRINQ